jgi:hypothetical protein
MDELYATPTLQATIRNDGEDGITFEIYAYRKLTYIEIEHEIALYVVARRKLKRGKTHKIFTAIGAPRQKSS